MAQSMDPIQSFTYLVDNIPQWLTRLEELNAQCDEQYERFYKLTRHGEVKLTRKKKNDSTESLRPNDDTTVPFLMVDNINENSSKPATTTVALAEASQSPLPNTSAPLAANQSTLKRKPASALSNASGSHGYRTKSMIIVYYDSAIQEGFEGIVKNVSNARSNLRKGRITATFQVRMASMGLPLESENTSPSTKIMLPSLGRRRENASDKQKFKVYDEADRDLEEAQNLSERAAHQFLRDGDCKTEIDAVRKRFEAARKLAKEELDRLKAKEEPEQVDVVKLETYDVKAIEQILDRAYSKIPTPLPPTKPVQVEMPPSKQMHFAATGAIEVDENSDTNSVKIDLNAIRRVTRRTQ